MPPPPRKAHFKPLTSLRFFAAMHVLAFHNHLDALTNPPSGIRDIIRTGYVSVSLFFVLSGFILAYTYLGDRERMSLDWRSFWIARGARIYPVYLVGLLLAAPFVFKAQFHECRPVWSALKILVMGGSCCTLTQSWIPPLALAWNSPGWSLSAEAFFYLLFPFVAPLIWRLTQRQTIIALGAIWLTSLAPPIMCWFVPIDGFSNCPATQSPSAGWLAKLIEFNPLLRLPEFLMGIAVCKLFLGKKRGEYSRSSSWSSLLSVGALVGIVALLGCGSRIAYPFLHNGLLDGLFALLIYGLGRNEGILARFLSMPIFVLLGEASYAIYILHVPLRNWMFHLLEWLYPNVHPSLPLFAAYTIVTLGVSVLIFKVIEEPTRRIIRRRLTLVPS